MYFLWYEIMIVNDTLPGPARGIEGRTRAQGPAPPPPPSTPGLKQGTMAVTSIILCTAAGTSPSHNATSLIIKSRGSEIRLSRGRRRRPFRPLPRDSLRAELGRDRRPALRTVCSALPSVFFGALRVVQEGNTAQDAASPLLNRMSGSALPPGRGLFCCPIVDFGLIEYK